MSFILRSTQGTYAQHKATCKAYDFAPMSFELWLSWHLKDSKSFGCRGCEYHSTPVPPAEVK
jgi:hypothetical protein